MALRNQPYIPLYVQDFLTDEKLNMCSICSQGVYIKLMCLFHKSNEYGGILLKQKDKQTTKQNMKQIDFFALKVAKLLPVDLQTITDALIELVDEGVLTIDGDFIFQKRMVKDNKVSEIRAEAGKLGGKKNSEKINFAKAKTEAKTEAKAKQNTEYENEIENEIAIETDIVISKKKEWTNLNQKKWIDDNCPTVLTMTKPLTNEGLNKLISEFGMTKVEEKLMAMENMPTLRKRYKDAYFTCRSWCKKDTKDTRTTTEILRDAEIANELNPSKCFNIYTGQYEYTNNKFNTNQ